MSELLLPCWQCDTCGFRWLKKDGIQPIQCPSSKCRSRKWNLGGAVAVPAAVNTPVKAAKGKRVPPKAKRAKSPVMAKSDVQGCTSCGGMNGLHQKGCKAKAATA